MSERVEPIPDHGDLMTVEEFYAAAEVTAFVNSDGDGCYATATEMYPDRPVDPRAIREGRERPGGFTHVMWFNK